MKKFIALLTMFAVIAIAFPAFAKSRPCSVCHGAGKVIHKQTVPVFNYRYDRKTGKNIRIPPYSRVQSRVDVCRGCKGKGYFD